MKLIFSEIELGISIYEKHIPKSRLSFYLKSGIFHEPGSPKGTQSPCWLRPCISACFILLIVVGGEDRTSSFNIMERYDPEMDSWSTVKSMQRKRAGAGVAVCDGKIYVAGKILNTILDEEKNGYVARDQLLYAL